MIASYYGMLAHHGLAAGLALAIYYAAIHFLARKICHQDDDENFGRFAILFVLAPFIVGGTWTLDGHFGIGAAFCGLTFLTLATFLGQLSLKATTLLTLASPTILCAATLLGTTISGVFRNLLS